MTPALNEALEEIQPHLGVRATGALRTLITISEEIERRKGRMQVGDIVTQYLAESGERRTEDYVVPVDRRSR